VHLEVDVPGGLELDCDAEMLTRVLENLLDNGLRYAPQRGKLVARAVAVGDTIELQVGNNGPPVPVEARALIFEKFGQTASGTGRMNLGLGLYFCRLVAEVHGGTIRVEETPALPTLFVFALPR
jgi:signal transduction histidine kinase